MVKGFSSKKIVHFILKDAPLSCSNSTFICQNGATCHNVTGSSNDLFGFTCLCATGYSGEYCEQSIK